MRYPLLYLVLIYILLCASCEPVCSQRTAGNPLTDHKNLIAATIPFIYNPPLVSAILIPVSINGEEPVPFVLDTGANVAITLDTRFAQKLHIKSTGSDYNRLDNAPLKKCHIEKVVVIGKDEDSNVHIDKGIGYIADCASIFADIGGTKVGGIIGLPVFEHFTSQFDFVLHTITLFANYTPPASNSSVLCLPIYRVDEGYRANVCSSKKKLISMLLDTGSTSTRWPEAKLKELVTSQARSTFYRTLNKFHCTHTALTTMPLTRQASEPGTEVNFIAASRGLLGLDVLARFRVTLDAKRKRLVLERASDYKERSRLPGWSGISLKQMKQQTGKLAFYVDTITPDAPAAHTDVRPGDKVIAVDDERLDDATLLNAQHLVDGRDQKPLSLFLLRNENTPLLTTVTPSSIYADPNLLRLGFTMSRTDHQDFVITSVDADSAESKAGYEVGDVVTKINALLVRNASDEEIVQEFRIRKGKVNFAIKKHARKK